MGYRSWQFLFTVSIFHEELTCINFSLRVLRRTSPINSFLLVQLCPAFIVHLACMVCKMGGRRETVLWIVAAMIFSIQLNCVVIIYLFDVDQSRYTEGKHGTRFRSKNDILTKVTKDSVQDW